MRTAAFALYWLNLIISVALCAGSIIIVAVPHFSRYGILSRTILFVFIIACIASFVIKKVCDDEYVKKHFGYQFRTALFFIIAYIVLMIVKENMLLVSYTLIPHLSRGLIITIFAVYIWFLYRNIKGIVYLSINKDL
ncbi:MAG: hypothetical protein LBP54_08815 [Campylobacteraceae bacterium]|jgi:uncharacterized membrane protein|nr:hypothetical protein [Campylobacteraceae bacterium]